MSEATKLSNNFSSALLDPASPTLLLADTGCSSTALLAATLPASSLLEADNCCVQWEAQDSFRVTWNL